MSHTFGPWQFVYRPVDADANYISRIPYAIERVVGGAVAPIADVCEQPQAEANARLIAAAPDLLAALEAAKGQLAKISYALNVDGRTADGITKMGAVLRIDAVAHDLNAAIAKAKGAA